MEIHRTNVRRCLSVVLLVAMLPLVALAGEKASPHRNLIDAAGRGDLAQVKALLAEGVDVNARDEMGVTPLMQASRMTPSTIQASFMTPPTIQASAMAPAPPV